MLELQLQHQSEYSGLISFRIDWFDFLAIQGTLKSLLQHHRLETPVLRYSAFFMVHLSHLYMTTGKAVALTMWNFVGKVMSLLFNILSRAEPLEHPGLVFPCHNFKASARYGKPKWG